MVVLVTAERMFCAPEKSFELKSPVPSHLHAIVFWDVWVNAKTKFSLCKGRSLLCYVINHFNDSIFW